MHRLFAALFSFHWHGTRRHLGDPVVGPVFGAGTPRKTAALLIVLWNVIILHARWGGMIHERGLMNMVTLAIS